MNDHPFLTGIGLGMAAGAAVGALMVKNEKTLNKAAQNTIKQMSRMAEDVTDAVVDKLPK